MRGSVDPALFPAVRHAVGGEEGADRDGDDVVDALFAVHWMR
jgi:hypothetical protein